jgi:hypothetical protein
MLKEFKEKGHILTTWKDVCSFDMDRIVWAEMGTTPDAEPLQIPDRALGDDGFSLEKEIEITQNCLAEKFLKPHWNIVRNNFVEITNGVDSPTHEWHHDHLVDDLNVGIIMYFDTMDPDIGGSISIKRACDDVITGHYCPKRYDLIIINQTEEILHKVEPLKLQIPRRVGIFHYWVEDEK